MNKQEPHSAPVLILSETQRDAGQVRELLAGEFHDLALLTDLERMATAFDSKPADVLILAFDTLEKSERYYLALYRQSTKLHTHPHRTIILSNKDNVAASYEACRKQLFDDYVLFWPMHYDHYRLAMSVHLALRDLVGRGALTRPVEPQRHAPFDALSGLFEANGAAVHSAESQNRVIRGSEASELQPVSQAKPTPTVLVVDDDNFMCKLLGRMLAIEGYQILLAHSASDVLLTIRSKRPDLIVMDVLMPGLNGIEITKRLKTVPGLASIPVIIVTGNSEDSIVKESLKAGAVDFVVKPVDRTAFLGKVKRALGRV